MNIVFASDSLPPARPESTPQCSIPGETDEGVREFPSVEGVYEEPILTVPDDLDDPAIPRRNHGFT